VFRNPFIYTSPQLGESNPQLETRPFSINVNIFLRSTPKHTQLTVYIAYKASHYQQICFSTIMYFTPN